MCSGQYELLHFFFFLEDKISTSDVSCFFFNLLFSSSSDSGMRFSMSLSEIRLWREWKPANPTLLACLKGGGGGGFHAMHGNLMPVSSSSPSPSCAGCTHTHT